LHSVLCRTKQGARSTQIFHRIILLVGLDKLRTKHRRQLSASVFCALGDKTGSFCLPTPCSDSDNEYGTSIAAEREYVTAHDLHVRIVLDFARELPLNIRKATCPRNRHASCQCLVLTTVLFTSHCANKVLRARHRL
jgi:hypothetical protein